MTVKRDNKPLETGNIYQGDCLDLMQYIPDKSIDMILCDLPYGTTACKWDTIIPLEPLWKQYKRIIKDNAAIVLTASQPFTGVLVTSNLKMFRYEWIWHKDKGGNIAILKYQPSKVHESVLLFSKLSHLYNPQMELRPKKNKRKNKPRINKAGIQGNKKFYIEHSKGMDDFKYPTSVKQFDVVRNGLHPTQKPIPLFEYLIKTYTNEGDLVLDNCIGSGTTAIAAMNTNRQWIGIEKDGHYCEVARKRIEEALKQGRLF